GLPDDHPAVEGGLRFLAAKRISDGETVRYPIFETDVWTTAFLVRALLESGLAPAEPPVSRAVAWLCACQRRGAWAFQERNTTMPDCDDVGMVVAALAMALDPSRGAPLPRALAA